MKGAIHGGGIPLLASAPEKGTNCRDRELEFTAYWFDGKTPQRTLFQFDKGLSKKPFRIVPKGDMSGMHASAMSAMEREGAKPYSRLVPRLHEPQWDAGVLEEVGRELTKGARGSTPDNNDLPAAYTYFGQFVAHEISDIAEVNRRDGEIVSRTAALDLDSIFSVSEPMSSRRAVWRGGVGVGELSNNPEGGAYGDLPREDNPEDTRSTAEIGEIRNDHNMGVAQIHVAISKFHHVLWQEARPAEFNRRRTMRHVQAIVLFDYLRKICDADVYGDVISNGRRIVRPGPFDHSHPFRIPIEFSAACFRIGHSMIRDRYTNWSQSGASTGLEDLLGFTAMGGQLNDTGGRLPAEWEADWSSLLGDPGAPGSTRNKAKAIDQFLNGQLGALRKQWFPDDMHEAAILGKLNLAIVTLKRGELFGIPSAQALAGALAPNGRGRLPVLPRDEILGSRVFGCADDSGLRRVVRNNDLHINTPLWLYCLLEAKYHHGGQRMGPFASRIVCETIHVAIETCDDGIISNGFEINFTDRESFSRKREFTLHDLIAIAEQWQPN